MLERIFSLFPTSLRRLSYGKMVDGLRGGWEFDYLGHRFYETLYSQSSQAHILLVMPSSFDTPNSRLPKEEDSDTRLFLPALKATLFRLRSPTQIIHNLLICQPALTDWPTILPVCILAFQPLHTPETHACA